MRPLIAITTTSVPESGIDRGPTIHLHGRYMAWIEALGLTSVLITPSHDDESVAGIVERTDGLVLPGGEDVDPVLYGDAPHPRLGVVNPRRDRVERDALAAALRLGRPILALCRGLQVLNVHLGGTLWQDLDTQRPGSIRHRQSGAWYERTHDVEVSHGSELAGIVGTGNVRVNSFHHQGIRDLAPGLVATAVATDGLVEAVEAETGGSWVVGVQWHPERHPDAAPDDDPDRRLFAAFRDVVRASRRPRPAAGPAGASS